MTHAVALVGAPLRELEVNAEWLPLAVGEVAEPVTFAISRVSTLSVSSRHGAVSMERRSSKEAE